MAFDLSTFIGQNIGSFVSDIIGKFKVDPTVALQAQTDITKLQYELQGKLVDQITSQIQVDQAEAANKSVFVAGWRPAIGWICGAALGMNYIIGPLCTWTASLAGRAVTFPQLDLGSLLPLLLGMLGLGAMRTVEKVNGAPGTDKLQ